LVASPNSCLTHDLLPERDLEIALDTPSPYANRPVRVCSRAKSRNESRRRRLSPTHGLTAGQDVLWLWRQPAAHWRPTRASLSARADYQWLRAQLPCQEGARFLCDALAENRQIHKRIRKQGPLASVCKLGK